MKKMLIQICCGEPLLEMVFFQFLVFYVHVSWMQFPTWISSSSCKWQVFQIRCLTGHGNSTQNYRIRILAIKHFPESIGVFSNPKMASIFLVLVLFSRWVMIYSSLVCKTPLIVGPIIFIKGVKAPTLFFFVNWCGRFLHEHIVGVSIKRLANRFILSKLPQNGIFRTIIK